MATANRKKLHKHFIRGRDPMAPFGDVALSLTQQVKAGQRSSWEEEEGEDSRRSGDNTVRGRERRGRETISIWSSAGFPIQVAV